MTPERLLEYGIVAWMILLFVGDEVVTIVRRVQGKDEDD